MFSPYYYFLLWLVGSFHRLSFMFFRKKLLAPSIISFFRGIYFFSYFLLSCPFIITCNLIFPFYDAHFPLFYFLFLHHLGFNFSLFFTNVSSFISFLLHISSFIPPLTLFPFLTSRLLSSLHYFFRFLSSFLLVAASRFSSRAGKVKGR